jgi:hypothetical protein
MPEQDAHWTLETALKILEHPTVDSKTWAEAVEWLLLNGPPALKEHLSQAALAATSSSFPDLSPQGYDAEGNPCYRIADLARALDLPMEEAARILVQKEMDHGVRQLRSEDESSKLQ